LVGLASLSDGDAWADDFRRLGWQLLFAPIRLPAGRGQRLHAARRRAAAGLRLEETKAVTDKIVRKVRERPEVASIFVNGGRVMRSGAEVRKATLVINLVAKEHRELLQNEVQPRIGANSMTCPTSATGF
jgi:multidrug efflux pump subunit AcrB